MKAIHPFRDVDVAEFFAALAKASQRGLLLDYDGTLAPFQIKRDAAIPHVGVVESLNEITGAGHTHVVVISGRSIADLIPLLQGLVPMPELWGSHGWERREVNGILHPVRLPTALESGLGRAREWAEQEGFIEHCELKPAGIAVHWRGLTAESRLELGEKAVAGWQPLVESAEKTSAAERLIVVGEGITGEQTGCPGDGFRSGFELHEFDGGIELRVCGRNKGYAVRSVLDELGPDAAVAYAGDDRTDEDAFNALVGRGLSILVREELRPTLANVWLKSPGELLSFLTRWSRSCTRTQ